MSKIKYAIGVDPGVTTGVAVWDIDLQKITHLASLTILDAIAFITDLHRMEHGTFKLYIEDARLRKWFGASGREVLQGAGSIKRDCGIWQEFCEHHGIDHCFVKPQAGATKWDAKTFAKMVKWPGRTNDHMRDAACLVVGMKAK